MTHGPVAAGLALAVLASLAINAGYLLQHVGGARAPAVSVRRPLGTLRGLGRSRLWLAGTAAGLGGSLMHIGALAVAPLSLVQAFSAGGLALAVPVAARVGRTGLRPGERAGVAAILGALALLAIRPAVASRGAVALPAWLAFGVIVLAAAGGLATVRGLRRAAALGVVTGLLYGLSDAATKAFTEALRAGIPAALATAWPEVIAAACAVAFFAFQRALQIGPPATVIALMTAAMNATAVAGGMALFGESLGASTAIAALHGTAMAGIGAAAWWLTSDRSRQRRALPVVRA